jgi:hypothetical protein
MLCHLLVPNLQMVERSFRVSSSAASASESAATRGQATGLVRRKTGQSRALRNAGSGIGRWTAVCLAAHVRLLPSDQCIPDDVSGLL